MFRPWKKYPSRDTVPLNFGLQFPVWIYEVRLLLRIWPLLFFVIFCLIEGSWSRYGSGSGRSKKLRIRLRLWIRIRNPATGTKKNSSLSKLPSEQMTIWGSVSDEYCCSRRGIIKYIEYHQSVFSSSELGPPASECVYPLSRTKGGRSNTRLRVRGIQFGRWKKSLQLCILCAVCM